MLYKFCVTQLFSRAGVSNISTSDQNRPVKDSNLAQWTALENLKEYARSYTKVNLMTESSCFFNFHYMNLVSFGFFFGFLQWVRRKKAHFLSVKKLS